MTVRVANDFKTEAQQQLANLLVENKSLKEKNRSLEGELTKAKGTCRKNLLMACSAIFSYSRKFQSRHFRDASINKAHVDSQHCTIKHCAVTAMVSDSPQRKHKPPL